MKTFRRVGIALMSVFMVAGLAACGDDDENENDKGGIGGGETGGLKAYAKCPDGHHPHLIDLGLPSGTKWSCCNVGASSPEGYGGYYAWGETEEKAVYDLNTCLYYKENRYVHIGDEISGTQYDVARVKWGAPWRMPTLSEMHELWENCSRLWAQQNGVNGICVTGPNGNSVFLPAAGDRRNESLSYDGSSGYYWSGTLDSGDEIHAYHLGFSSGGWGWSDYSRFNGHSVRPVAE
ncbi:MAG TPA: hypothetical protein PLN34_07575 [Alloprevotella sp.]|nr:hypothetical protein [Alloprevotella sp.]